ncbi:flagellar basal body-associated FliL family protein [Agrobacterium sp. a22-2]|uniref:flagellar basal body-associated FliL family protein n=1 Tax=Agrobacterium sp. a22-2 TaxID=2283840 RepID=UPI001446AF59|nr:flagellar basal body-associated FliL family protein [Agrobacterium sp. a22-2]NKN34826.1 flagellar basal body-associated FliL family protein [Agrobacterium sp. a22-2]
MQEAEANEGGKKKSSLILLIAAIAGLTVLGGGGGWVVGMLIAPKIQSAEADAAATEAAAAGAHGAGTEEEGLPHISTEANGVVQLEPITTNLAYPSESWIRLEVALLFNGPADVTMSESIHQDIMAYMRTVSLQQVEGPRGFQYLKEDIQERVDLRSEGRVSRVMFRTFVIE